MNRLTSSRNRAFTLIELLVVIGVIALLISILFPALNLAQEYGRQAKCGGGSLKNVALALHQYANDNDGKLPSLPHATTNTWRYIGSQSTTVHDAAGNNVQSNTRALYTCLIRGGYITADTFICAATKRQPVPDSQVRSCWDFPGARYIDYSYQNHWTFTTKLTDREDMPVMADRNPQIKFVPTADGDQATVNNDIPPDYYTKSGVKQSANSPNHGGRGQNVLYLGGQVRWHSNPLAGVNCRGVIDNIYTRNDGTAYGQALSDAMWTLGPYERLDTWLVP